MNALLTSNLREFAKLLREMDRKGAATSELREKKGELMEELYKLLCINLSVPTETFFWKWREKDDVFRPWRPSEVCNFNSRRSCRYGAFRSKGP